MTGKGLYILIVCDSEISSHVWMSFSSWLSIQKNLPDAEVMICCSNSTRRIYDWAYRLKVKLIYYSDIKEIESLNPVCDKKLIISPYVVAVRELNELIGPVSAKSDTWATFVDYSEGCGTFMKDKYVNPPFGLRASLFATDEMTINERRVLDIWRDSYQLFSMVK